MKHKINTFLVAALLLTSSVLVAIVSSTAFAATCVPKTTTSISNTNGSGDTTDKTSFEFNCKTTDVGINDLVVTILSFLNVAVGVAVLGGVIFGGITYSTAGGNPAKVKKGATIIGSALGGLVLYLLMFAIINFLLPPGTLN